MEGTAEGPTVSSARSPNKMQQNSSSAAGTEELFCSDLINVAIKHCHINKIFYSRFARPLRGNRKTWQLLLRQVHVFQIGKEIFTCRSNNWKNYFTHSDAVQHVGDLPRIIGQCRRIRFYSDYLFRQDNHGLFTDVAMKDR